MRATFLMLTAACLLLTTGSATASPQPSHDDCEWSDGGALIHVWRKECQGVAFWSFGCNLPEGRDEHVNVTDGYVVHVLVLYGPGCLTGVLLQPVP